MSAFLIYKDGSSRIWTEAEMRSDAFRGLAPDSVVVMEPLDADVLKTRILPFTLLQGFELFVMRGNTVLPATNVAMLCRIPSLL